LVFVCAVKNLGLGLGWACSTRREGSPDGAGLGCAMPCCRIRGSGKLPPGLGLIR